MTDIKCPLCHADIRASEYLHYVFPDDIYAEIMANLIGHYRHEHINYYDRSWRNERYAQKNLEYTTHDRFKAIVNNRAKRQLMRGIMKSAMKIPEKVNLIKAIIKLQHNDGATKTLRRKYLDKLRHQYNKTMMTHWNDREWDIVVIGEEDRIYQDEFEKFENGYKQARLEIKQ